MAHVFILGEGRELWEDLFLGDLLKRRYPYHDMDNRIRMIQPNPREVKLYDISLPKECIPFLMEDLAPFSHNNPGSLYSPLKDKVDIITRFVRGMAGLKPFKPMPDSRFARVPVVGRFLNRFVNLFKKEPGLDYESSDEVRHAWINLKAIGWKEDAYDPTSTWRHLPKGGELV